jgi:phage FluMu gp28-like protein
LKAEKKNVDELTFQREYEAQFVEDSNCYFPRHLILQCVDGEHELLNREALQGRRFKGDYYIGVDFGKQVDHTALAVLEQSADNVVRLVYLKQLPLGTQYTEAIGWIKRLNEAFQFSNVRLDQTGVGEAPIEEVKKFLPNAEGVILSARMKLELLSKLLLLMQNKQLTLPLDRELIAQINGQQYQMYKTGELLFSHPAKSHDDQLWALALAAWGLSSPRPRFLPISRSF